MTPYVGEVIILTCVTIFTVWVAFSKQQWQFLWGPCVIWLAFALYVYFFQLKYKVLFDESGVTMRASGGERYIRFDAISEIRYEVAQTGEFAAQSRPFRRIVIQGHDSDFIDVSLRHFRLEDIETLMKVIHRHKPDLEITAIPGLGDSALPASSIQP